MADLKEQRVCIKFCFLLGKTATETVTMLREAFKEEALSQARVYEWFSWFKSGDMSLEDQPRSGRPSTTRNDENIQKIRNAIMFGSIDWSFVELMSTNFNRRTSHETSCCEWLLHQDNAPAHTALSVRQFLMKKTGSLRLCTPLLPGPGTLQFFPVSKKEEGP